MGSKAKIIFLLFLLAALLPKSALAEDYAWGPGELLNQPGWQIINSAYSFEGNSLVLTSDVAPRVSSPPLNIPSEDNVFEIRIDCPSEGVGALGLLTSDNGVVTKYFRLSPGKRLYRVYFGDSVRKGHIQGFVAEFYGGERKAYRLEAFRFFKPDVPELLRVLWSGFWEPEIIKVSTVNSVTTPSFGPLSLMSILYIFMAVIVAASIGWRVRSGKPLDMRTVTFALIAAFLVGSVALAIRMDYNWARFWAGERATLSGKSVPERIRAVQGGEIGSFLMFVDFVRESVPAGKTVAPAARGEGDRLATMARYYLLPVRTSAKPDYLWVYGEKGLYYDPASLSLKTDETVVASGVRLFKNYGGSSAVYEVIR